MVSLYLEKVIAVVWPPSLWLSIELLRSGLGKQFCQVLPLGVGKSLNMIYLGSLVFGWSAIMEDPGDDR